MRVREVLDRILGREIVQPESQPEHTTDTLERVDHLLDNVGALRVTVVPKNARALAELRRLEGHARR